MSNKATVQSWDWDLRVRERNLKAGIISEKEVEKMLHALGDLTGEVDTMTLVQPAVSGEEDS